VEYLPQGRVRYRLAFQDAPWLDSNDFVSDRPFARGDSMDVNDREATTTWWVADVWEEPEGSPDTLVMTKFKT
jgi:hypothetical protein